MKSPGRFGAVIDNVVSNAVKYSSTGSVVRVRVYEDDSHGVLAVSDSGPGIRSDEASRLYSRGGACRPYRPRERRPPVMAWRSRKTS